MQKTTDGYPTQIDVTNCDLEPIHIIGKSQAHGVIVACDKKTYLISQCSENSTKFFGERAEELLGKPLSVLLPQKYFVDLHIRKGEKILLPRVSLNGSTFLVIAHLSDESFIFDFEKITDEPEPVVYQDQLTKILNELNAADSTPELCNRAAYLVKTFFGYDRVMLYKFDEEWNGEVIAEEREENLEPWLGLHYPATDIPRPSRELFLKQGVRTISDVNYAPALIIPEISPVNHKPLDLSRSELRAVSPIHIQYLKNMGVGASLTAAIVLNGKLWGLLACHHYSAKFINYHQRQSVKFLTQIFTNRLAVKTTDFYLKKTQQASQIKKKLIDQLNLSGNILSAITEKEILFTDLITCSGGAVFLGGELRLIGKTPSREEIRELAKTLLRKKTLFHTNNLEKIYPSAAAYKQVASGILSVKIGETNEDYLIWFREETSENVSWGGKPQKEEVLKEGIKYLSPRTSFKKWTEEVSGISQPWRDYEFDAALALRENITHKIVQQQKEEIAELNQRLTLVNKELEAYTYSISHDLRAPLRGISGYARILIEDHSSQLDQKGYKALKAIQESTAGLNHLINDLLTLAKLGNDKIERKPVEVKKIVEGVLVSINVKENYSKSRIAIKENIPEIEGEERLLTQLFSNLIENALKYSNRVSNPKVEIGYTEQQEGPTVFYVKDNGIGFDPKLRKKIFEVFSRLVGEEYSGTGIGLAIAKKVVEAHKGKIWVESSTGKGSIFYFTLAGDAEK